MVPLPLYLVHAEAGLLAGYDDFKRAAGIAVGWGSDDTLWTTQQSAELDRDVQEAYRWCLYPQTIPGERIPHTWSFLEQTTTVVTTSGTYNYTFPTDYGSFVGRFMIWPSGEGYDPPYRTNDTEILMLRQHQTTSGRPQCFATRWLAQTRGSNQRQELILWPTPDATYTLTYRYAVLTGPLGTDNPYPLGGPRMSQLLLEACRAIGEYKKNGQRTDSWSVFITELQSAIQLDKGSNTSPTMGVMRGADTGYGYRQRKRGTATYAFGPDAAGAYTLEV
jgi:hypothetical protein